MLRLVADDDRTFFRCACGKSFLWDNIAKEIELQRLVFSRVGNITYEIGAVVSQKSDILTTTAHINLVTCFKINCAGSRVYYHF